MSRILTIDPGMESGLVVASVDDDSLPEILWKGQTQGGLVGALKTLASIQAAFAPSKVVCEAFSPRPGQRSWRLDELEPLRWEGWVFGWEPQTVFRRPESRKLINGSVSASGDFLRSIGYWTLPSELSRPDANDCNSAMMHLFGYLRDQAHMPTIEAVIDYGDKLYRESE